MGGLTLTVNGVEQQLGRLGKIGSNIKNLQPAFKAASVLVMESVNRNFMEGGRPDKWQTLRPLTIRSRKGSGSPEPLRDTGMLMNSIGVPGQSGILAFTPWSVRVGTNVPYAKFHNDGIGVPKREFMILQEEDIEKVVKVFDEHTMKGTE